jgi:hypothetical protein
MADQGTAYELPPPTHDAELTEVRRGTEVLYLRSMASEKRWTR